MRDSGFPKPTFFAAENMKPYLATETDTDKEQSMSIRDLQYAIQSAIDEAPGVTDDAEVAVRDGKVGCLTYGGEFLAFGKVCDVC